MSQKTVEINHKELLELDGALGILDNADLPPISTVRFSRTLEDEILSQVRHIKKSIQEKRDAHQKTDEDGDPVFEVVVGGKKIGESGAKIVELEGEKAVQEYKDIDLEGLDYEDLGIEFEGEEPPVQGKPVFENPKKLAEARRKILNDTAELSIQPFPEDEAEEVLKVFARGKAQEKADRIAETLGLEEEEKEDVEEILGATGGGPGLKPSEFGQIEFLFPEGL